MPPDVPAESDPGDDLVDALLSASRALVAVAARSVASVEGVTLPQFRALVVLSNRSVTVSELATALAVHPTTATRLCDRLVRKRLVRRVQGRVDRRETELHLAPAGRRLVTTVTERRRRDLASIAERIPAAATAGTIEALSAFADAADDLRLPADVFGWSTEV